MKALEFIKTKGQSLRSLHLIKNNPMAQRVMVAWTLYPVKPLRTGHVEVTEKHDHRLVRAELWDQAGKIDMAELASTADVPETKAAKIFKRLQDGGLVWPDGTVSVHAERVLDAEAESYIRDLSYRSQRKLT